MPEDALLVEAEERTFAEDEDLTAWPEFGLSVLATEDIDDLEPAALDTDEDLVADALATDELLVADPFLARVMEELLTPVERVTEPSPVLVEDPAVASLGLKTLSPPP